MKRFRNKVKRFAVVLLSACLVLQRGAVSAWAAETVPEAAAVEAATVAEEAAKTEEAAVAEAVAVAEAAAEAEEAALVETAAAAEEAALVETAAAEVGPGAASSSDAVKENEASEASAAEENAAASEAGTALETASASDALLDEDGLLMDGEVIDDAAADVNAEAGAAADADAAEEELPDDVIAAPGMKTEIIDPQLALSSWYVDYDYYMDRSERTITLYKYIGSGTQLEVPATTMFGNYSYRTILEPYNDDTGSIWGDTSVVSLDIAAGVTVPEDMSSMFADCTNLEYISLSGVNTHNVRYMSYMFDNCPKLREIDMGSVDMSNVTYAYGMFRSCSSLALLTVPTEVQVNVDLPHTMTRVGSSAAYTQLPKYLSTSFQVEADVAPHVFVKGVKINTAARTIEKGKTFQMAAWPQPSNATNKAVTWKSSNTSVATITGTGLVKGIKEGSAVITVTTEEGGYTATCRITVGIPVTSLKINTTARTMNAGQTFQLKAWPQPTNASNRTVIWTSSSPSVAKVDSTGLVTAVNGGSAVITAKTQDHGFTKTCTITVKVPVTGVKINTAVRTVTKGSTFQMKAWPQPSNASNKAVTWTSSDTSVATVSSTGLVKAIKNGTANITVKTVDGGKTATCKITVGIPVTSLKINTTARTMNAGQTFQLKAWPQPTNASNRTVIWTSSSPSVAKVDSTGLVTAVNGGSAVITAKTQDHGFTETCTITVKVPVTSVKINTTARTVNVGATFQLAAWPQPSNATNKAVTWTSSNTAVATVSATGLVTAKKKGTATMTVKTADGGYTAKCTITVQ